MPTQEEKVAPAFPFPHRRCQSLLSVRGGKTVARCSEPKTQLLPPSREGRILPRGKRLLWTALIQEQRHVEGYARNPNLSFGPGKVCRVFPGLCPSHARGWVPGLQVRRLFCRSPEAPGPLLCRGQRCPLPAAGGSERWRSAEQLAILQFPLVTKLHMFRKLNLCQRLVVPSQKIQSDLYIALHKFLVNLYNHLERESLLISQRTTAMATSVTETAGLYEAVPGTSSRAGGGGKRKKKKPPLRGPRPAPTAAVTPPSPDWREAEPPAKPMAVPSPEARGCYCSSPSIAQTLYLLSLCLRAGSRLMRGCRASDGSRALNASISTFYFICNLKPMVP